MQYSWALHTFRQRYQNTLRNFSTFQIPALSVSQPVFLLGDKVSSWWPHYSRMILCPTATVIMKVQEDNREIKWISDYITTNRTFRSHFHLWEFLVFSFVFVSCPSLRLQWKWLDSLDLHFACKIQEAHVATQHGDPLCYRYIRR